MVALIGRMSPSSFSITRKSAGADAYIHPEDHLPDVWAHSDFDLYSVHLSAEVTVTHPAIAGKGATVVPGTHGLVTITGQDQTITTNLVAHGLPYRPRFMIAVDDEILSSGTIIQRVSNMSRYVSFGANDTYIRVKTSGSSTTSTLPSITATYKVLVFRDPLPDAEKPQFRATPSRVIAGQGKLDTDETHMRAVADDESPFYVPLGPILANRRGGFRTVTPKGVVISEAAYGGGFAGSPSIQVSI